MTKTEYAMLILRIANKMEAADSPKFDEPENGMELVDTFQRITDELKEIVDLYNKEKFK